MTMAPLISDGTNVYVVHGWKTVAAYSLDGERKWLKYL